MCTADSYLEQHQVHWLLARRVEVTEVVCDNTCHSALVLDLSVNLKHTHTHMCTCTEAHLMLPRRSPFPLLLATHALKRTEQVCTYTERRSTHTHTHTHTHTYLRVSPRHHEVSEYESPESCEQGLVIELLSAQHTRDLCRHTHTHTHTRRYTAQSLVHHPVQRATTRTPCKHTHTPYIHQPVMHVGVALLLCTQCLSYSVTHTQAHTHTHICVRTFSLKCFSVSSVSCVPIHSRSVSSTSLS